MVTGYDMVLVENFTKYIHRTMIKYRQDIQEVLVLFIFRQFYGVRLFT